jgi:hypothetical protein
MRYSRLAATLAAATLGASCMSTDAAYYGYFPTSMYNSRSLGYVQSQGPVPLIVNGTPFPGAPMNVLARNVAASMTGANGGPPLTFTVDPTGPREADYFVVVVFGTPNLGGADLCQVRYPEVFPTGARAHAEAMLCIESKKISEIKGDMLTEARGPDDPQFVGFVRGLAFNLMPPTDRNCPRSFRAFGGC